MLVGCCGTIRVSLVVFLLIKQTLDDIIEAVTGLLQAIQTLPRIVLDADVVVCLPTHTCTYFVPQHKECPILHRVVYVYMVNRINVGKFLNDGVHITDRWRK